MNRTAFLVSVVLAGATTLGCGEDPASGSSNSFPAAALTTLQSGSGAYTIEVRTAPDQPPGREVLSVEYRVTGKDGQPVDGLSVTVLPWMPEMGHGASITPAVTAKGGGRYVVSDVELFMPGKWELRTTLGPTSDSATPAFQIP